jgi:hypothetical protein
VRSVNPSRTSPLLWTVGVILFMPLIVAGGLFAVAATVVGGLWRGARQLLGSPNTAAAPQPSPGLASVRALRPTPADELDAATAFSRAA